MSNTNKKLLLFLICVLFAILIQIIYQGSLDSFAPKHLGIAQLLSQGTDLNDSTHALFQQVPGFYAFCGSIIAVTNIDLYQIPLLPIIAVPSFFIIFGFMRIFSKDTWSGSVISLLFTFCIFSLPSTSSSYLSLFPHAIGVLLFYTFLITIKGFYKQSNEKATYTAICIPLLISIPFISYNFTYYFIFILLSMFVYATWKDRSKGNKKARSLLNMAIIMIVVWLGLSTFIYKTFLPSLEQWNFSTGPLELFFARFFGQGDISEIAYYTAPVPTSITIINILKYCLYLIAVFYGVFIIVRYRSERYFKQTLAPFFLSITVTVLLWIIIRLYVGGLAITAIFYIVLFSVISFTHSPSFNRNFITRTVIIGATLLFLSLNLTSNIVLQANHLMIKDDYKYLKIANSWAQKNTKAYVYYPDQLSYSWSFLTYCEYYSQYPESVPATLSTKETLNLYKSAPLVDNRIIFINYRTNIIHSGGWTSLKSLSNYRQDIENNPSISAKIYSLNDDIALFVTS